MTENSVSVSPRADWLYELKKSYTRPEDLLSALQLDDSAYADDIKARQLFSMRVPRPFVQQMNIGDYVRFVRNPSADPNPLREPPTARAVQVIERVPKQSPSFELPNNPKARRKKPTWR